MREYSTPLSVTVPTTGNLTDDIVANAEQHPAAVALARRGAPGDPWTDVTTVEFLDEVRSTAKGLIAEGITPGDRVALLARTRYEWTLLDYAIWYAGAVTVPVYETSSPEQAGWILADSGARAIVLENERHAALVEEVRAGSALEHVWMLDAPGDAVGHLQARGAQVTDEELEARRADVGPDALATVIYTSGTTGRPRGCMLSHGSFMFELEVATAELGALFETEDASTLLFLPQAHVLARVIQVGAIKQRVRLGHGSDIRRLVEDLDEFRPTFVLAVPRVFEKIFTTASQRAAAEGRGRMFDRATDVAIAYSRALDRGRGRVGPVLRAQHAVFERLVYESMRGALGGSCRFVVSGGAPLGERLGHFYRGIGLPILEGYGLTETTGAITVNAPDAVRIGSVGRPLPGTSVRVDDDGELLVRGGQVMSGYWRDDAGTREVLGPDGWLRTGDLGEIDSEGFVRITGRRKEIIVTAGGKNVAPDALENQLRAHPLVSQCMVVGDGKPYVAALVTLDPDAFAQWAEQHGKSGTLADSTRDPDLVAEIQSAVDEANKAVSQAESIRRFLVLPRDWTEESGELTPSLKLRRYAVLRQFRREIQSLYDD